MAKLEYNTKECTCGRGRCGVPKTTKDHDILHKCPHNTLITNEHTENLCNCCPICTVNCLPMKIMRSENSLKYLFDWIN
jgi:hypothetical protein